MVLRVGVIGCGLIAQIAHLPYLQELGHLYDVRALCDLSPNLVQQLGERYNVAGQFFDYRELLAQDLDAVFVLTRDHAAVAIAAAESGKHVFVEKPLCFNLGQSEAMIAAARKHGVRLMVGYMKRYDPGYERALELFRKMEGGGLIRVHHSVGSPARQVAEMFDILKASDLPQAVLAEAKANETASLRSAIGKENDQYLTTYSLLLHLWSHDINTLRGAFGEPVAFRYAEMRQGTSVGLLPAVQIAATLDYGPELSCMWETQAFVANEWWDEELAFFGRERTVRVRFPNPYLKNSPTIVRVEETIDGALVEQQMAVSYDEAYKRELRHFYDCIVSGKEPLTNGEDGQADLAFAVNLVRAFGNSAARAG
jgi:predicted dehydrogenase